MTPGSAAVPGCSPSRSRGVTRLLDLNAFGWTPLDESGDGVLIAATCTLAELARWPPAAARYAPAAALARQCCHALLGSFKVHNVATVGGNICLSLPAGPMTSLASALDGAVLLRGPGGGRSGVPVADFVTGDGRNGSAPANCSRTSGCRRRRCPPGRRSGSCRCPPSAGPRSWSSPAATPAGRPSSPSRPRRRARSSSASRPRRPRPRPWPGWTRRPRSTSTTCTATRPGARP